MTQQTQPNLQLLGPVEGVINVLLALIGPTAPFEPAVAAVEAGINPLIASIANGSAKTTDVMAGYGALIALTQTLQKSGIAPAVLAKIKEYEIAAQDGTAAALLASTKGYDPAQLTQLPVVPLEG